MLLGIDGGGTKTDALLTDNEGNVLFRRVGGGSNLNDSGLGAVEEHLRALFADLPAGPIDALYAGVAGCATSDNSQILGQCLRELLPQAKCIEVTSDMPNAYYTVDGVRDGICVVAGTGASGGALVGGKLRQVGGWGHLIDDAGSGFDVGRAVLRAVLRAHDGAARRRRSRPWWKSNWACPPKTPSACSIAKGGTKSPALRRWPLPPWRKTKWRAASWKPRRRNFAPSSAPRRGI